jgi:hypothetical protein
VGIATSKEKGVIDGEKVLTNIICFNKKQKKEKK